MSVGGLSVGGLSVGGLSVGGLSVGGLSVGGLSVGGLSVNCPSSLDIAEHFGSSQFRDVVHFAGDDQFVFKGEIMRFTSFVASRETFLAAFGVDAGQIAIDALHMRVAGVAHQVHVAVLRAAKVDEAAKSVAATVARPSRRRNVAQQRQRSVDYAVQWQRVTGEIGGLQRRLAENVAFDEVLEALSPAAVRQSLHVVVVAVKGEWRAGEVGVGFGAY